MGTTNPGGLQECKPALTDLGVGTIFTIFFGRTSKEPQKGTGTVMVICSSSIYTWGEWRTEIFGDCEMLSSVIG